MTILPICHVVHCPQTNPIIVTCPENHARWPWGREIRWTVHSFPSQHTDSVKKNMPCTSTIILKSHLANTLEKVLARVYASARDNKSQASKGYFQSFKDNFAKHRNVAEGVSTDDILANSSWGPLDGAEVKSPLYRLLVAGKLTHPRPYPLCSLLPCLGSGNNKSLLHRTGIRMKWANTYKVQKPTITDKCLALINYWIKNYSLRKDSEGCLPKQVF